MSDLTSILDGLDPDRLAAHVDVEGKLPRALDVVAGLAGRDAVLVDAGRGDLARRLAAVGANVTALVPVLAVEGLEAALAADPVRAGTIQVVPGDARSLGLPDGSADIVLGGWTVYRGPDPAEIAEADRVLRPGGRHVVIHDYGRDDVSRLADPARPEYTSWSRRDGPFLRGGFKIHVVHCWWTFDSLESATDLLEAAYGAVGREVAAGLRRPRLTYNVAIYHRLRED